MAKNKSHAHPIMPRESTLDRKYRAECDLRTMQSAEEIRSDKSRMSAAKKLAAEQASALSKLAK